VSACKAGQIVVVDWRDALPKEPNKLRPAIVVEDDLFQDDYPNIILVPLSGDKLDVIEDLSVTIDPSPENGCTKVCYALTFLVTATVIARVRATATRISDAQLAEIRRKIVIAIAG
jgi:mRNA interferase MazF